MQWPLDIRPFTKDLPRLILDIGAIKVPPFLAVFRQLEAVATYVDDRLQAMSADGCIAVESQYIDRDFIQDYSIFYSTNLTSYPNFCTRLHFFAGKASEISAKITDIGSRRFQNRRDYIRECRTFSDTHYIGFCVIKPLAGTPVGRTVLRNDRSSDKVSGCDIRYESTRVYHAHYAAIDLTVHGLAFQQQDVGVSACATTALWCSLNKARDLEDIGVTTPAQITSLAAQYALPFGRSMPSGGLSLDQMCQAIRAFGLAPHLLTCARVNSALFYLYSALKSGFAPVFVLKRVGEQTYHAVAGIGMETCRPEVPVEIVNGASFKSQELQRVFIHDDRLGPSIAASVTDGGGELHLTPVVTGEDWVIRHIILPLHSKIRISLSDLYKLVMELLGVVLKERITSGTVGLVAVDAWIMRAVDYFGMLLFDNSFDIEPAFVQRYSSARTYSRYVGIIRLSAPDFGTLDVLVDTTSTLRNLQFLSIAAFGKHASGTIKTTEFLAGVCKCQSVYEVPP